MKGEYKYVIVGGGLAGASAIKGIREHDKDGSILLYGAEPHRPYDRPPLSKKLWFGKKKVEEIFIDPPGFYEENGVELRLGVKAVSLDAKAAELKDDAGNVTRYGKLLLATGAAPKKLPIPGGSLSEVCYYRSLDDYSRLREKAAEGSSAIIIGGGFIGSELAAALSANNVSVTMLFPSPYLCSRVLPKALGYAVQDDFIKRGVRVFANTSPSSIEYRNGRFTVTASDHRLFESDMLIAGAGVAPSVELAEGAGLILGDGIDVDTRLRTSDPDIYAAGDAAYFPYRELGRRMRVEHWDNALSQGKLAGENMAGAGKEYVHMPYFFSDLFDFGYEAVGEVSSNLEVVADWEEENKKGVLYYLKGGLVKGVMLCNVWDKVDEARELIRKKEPASPKGLMGWIR
ncbi:3-phenylpropionate/trans-cinnamate dioxygenase ferredoxin reductase component [uncultured bacterium]|nr:3-phenylpropionate/trans-cinnamate dioxygenase ferredoxin reductase component [uncultured bacterium]